MPKILVSMCVVGHPVRYNGSAKTAAHEALERWQREGRLVPVCPELAGGFSVPRPPAEIAHGESGQRVLSGAARIVDVNGTDVTALFVSGAHTALALARTHDCRFAILPTAVRRAAARSSTTEASRTGGTRAPVSPRRVARARHRSVRDTEIDALDARLKQLSQAETTMRGTRTSCRASIWIARSGACAAASPCDAGQTRSIAIAMPRPTPMHIVHSAKRPFARCS